jgi:molybdopterin converting factor small subunit
MKITVLFFGVAQDIAGVRKMPLELMEGATAIDLRSALASRFAGLDEGLAYALAVNEKLCNETHLLSDGDVAAVLPPVSGG